MTTTRGAATHLSGSGSAGHSGPARQSLLDILESSDHDIIDWAWLCDCLGTATCRDGEETTQFLADALTCAGGHATAGAAADAAVARHVQRLASPTTYVLERCLSELHGEWEEVLRTRFGEATINGLDAGAAHQFRVRAVNAAGAASPSGRATVINTLLNSPPPPRLARAHVRATTNRHPRASAPPHGDVVGVGGFERRFAVSSTTVKLVWLGATDKLTGGHGLNGRGGGPSDRILAEWTGAAGEDEGAVSLTAVLARYSHGREDATFDGKVLPDVLTRLGAHRTHDAEDTALRAAWDELRDAARDVVRTAHFAAWWNADVVTHILQRDQGVPAGRSAGGPSLGTVTTYRGSGRGTEARLLRGTRRLPRTQHKIQLLELD